jgi:hypothetical protein
MARLSEREFTCPNCGHRREMTLTHRISGEEEFLGRTLSEVDVPPLAIVRARNGPNHVYLELTGDMETFFRFA